MIRFLNVTCQHASSRGVLNVSLTIERGDFVLLYGPTGAGKTTLLRLIYLDLLPDSGQVMIDSSYMRSTSPRDLAALRRKMGIIFPESRLLSDRTVFDNVALPLCIAGEPHKRVLRQVNRLLFRFGLQARSRAFPGELSSGEQKKAAIARALVNRPFIILADEPLSNIDAEASAEIVAHLRDVNAEGTTILAATHLPQAFHGVARRIIHLQDGRLVPPTSST